jgi:sec-independent protein translocase protein TatB
MFDIGWSELLVIGAVALIVVGPKDLPGMLRTGGRMVAKARGMAREFQGAMEDAAREADLKEFTDIKKDVAGWSKSIGADAPAKFAKNLMKTDAKPKEAPAPGSLDAADAAEAAGWEAEQAARAAEAARIAGIERSAAELEADVPNPAPSLAQHTAAASSAGSGAPASSAGSGAPASGVGSGAPASSAGSGAPASGAGLDKPASDVGTDKSTSGV